MAISFSISLPEDAFERMEREREEDKRSHYIADAIRNAPPRSTWTKVEEEAKK